MSRSIPQASGVRSTKRTRKKVNRMPEDVETTEVDVNAEIEDEDRPVHVRPPRPRLRGGARTRTKARASTPARTRTAPQRPSTSPAVEKRAQTRTEHVGDVVERLELASLSTDELHEVMEFAISTIQERRVEDQDLDAIMEQGFAECFTAKGIATIPQCINGIVVVPGSVLVKNARGDHECNLYTVRIGDEDRWSWDFDDKILLSKSFTDGSLRRTITLYPAIDGMLVFGHDRKKGNKKGSQWPIHTYKSGGVKPLKLRMEDGLHGRFVVAPAVETRNLPVPSGIEDS